MGQRPGAWSELVEGDAACGHSALVLGRGGATDHYSYETSIDRDERVAKFCFFAPMLGGPGHPAGPAKRAVALTAGPHPPDSVQAARCSGQQTRAAE